jgi:hypothetical protein
LDPKIALDELPFEAFFFATEPGSSSADSIQATNDGVVFIFRAPTDWVEGTNEFENVRFLVGREGLQCVHLGLTP